MYNLKNVNDPKEYEFGANATKLNAAQINGAKDDFWKIEDEIRLVAFFENQLQHKPLGKKIFYDINRKNEKVSYNLLSIDNHHSDEKINNHLSEICPCIKIKEIIVGYNVMDYEKTKNVLRELLRSSLNYSVKISQSCFQGKME